MNEAFPAQVGQRRWDALQSLKGAAILLIIVGAGSVRVVASPQSHSGGHAGGSSSGGHATSGGHGGNSSSHTSGHVSGGSHSSGGHAIPGPAAHQPTAHRGYGPPRESHVSNPSLLHHPGLPVGGRGSHRPATVIRHPNYRADLDHHLPAVGLGLYGDAHFGAFPTWSYYPYSYYDPSYYAYPSAGYIPDYSAVPQAPIQPVSGTDALAVAGIARDPSVYAGTEIAMGKPHENWISRPELPTREEPEVLPDEREREPGGYVPAAGQTESGVQSGSRPN